MNFTAFPSRCSSTDLERTYQKVTRRVVPLLFFCYLLAYLDRINIGYAQLQMRFDLHFSDAIYGLGASMFFVGYVLFEVPSNVLLKKLGARKTMLRIMLCWGVVSMSTMFVKSPIEFYVARFFLGVFEAGFFPGILFYLTLWFPADRRGCDSGNGRCACRSDARKVWRDRCDRSCRGVCRSATFRLAAT